MQMNLDFCFIDDARIIAVAGWTTQARPGLRLHVGDTALEQALVTRHVRRDLRSSEPLGVIALFDLSSLDEGVDPRKATFHLAEGNHFNEIANHRLFEDARRLVEIGVDEVFFALLRLIAGRHLRLSDDATGRELCARLRIAPSAPREAEGYVLAVDRCQASGTGQGALVGWYLPASASAEALSALAIADDMIVPVDLMPQSMPRADLAAYAPRYRFTGRDGFAGGWRFPSPPVGPVRLLVMVPGEPFLPGVMVGAETAPHAEIAAQMTIATLGMDDIADRRRLRAAMLPDSLPRPVPASEPPGADDDQDSTLLILDHDLAETDLRDVLRRIGPYLRGELSLHLLRPRLTTHLQNGIEGAARELPSGLRLAEASLDISRPATLPGRVVYARSAGLFQFDPARLFAPTPAEARVVILDPIGTVLASPGAEVARFARDLLPFALSMRGAEFFDLLDQIPRCFLTEEARLRLMVEALMTEGTAQVGRADIVRYFEGRSGPHCESFADGRDWHAYDAESRRLIEEVCAQ